jgi:hypothetical protein
MRRLGVGEKEYHKKGVWECLLEGNIKGEIISTLRKGIFEVLIFFSFFLWSSRKDMDVLLSKGDIRVCTNRVPERKVFML